MFEDAFGRRRWIEGGGGRSKEVDERGGWVKEVGVWKAEVSVRSKGIGGGVRVVVRRLNNKHRKDPIFYLPD